MDFLLSLLVGSVLVGFIFLVVFRSSRRRPPDNHALMHDEVTDEEDNDTFTS